MSENKEKAKSNEYEFINLEIVTKDGNIVYSDKVAMVNFPGVEGVFTVMGGHTPFLSTLRIGEIKYKLSDEDLIYKYATVIGGICEVNGDKINVITNACELAEKIDVKRAENSKQRAEERLKNPTEEIDVKRADYSLQRANIRIAVANSFTAANK